MASLARGTLRVPPYPAVALKLGEIVRRKDFGLPEILHVLSADQSLVADVLRCANSAYFNRGAVTTLQQAVLRVGADEVSRLALVAGLAGQLATPSCLQSIKRQVWECSVASAIVAQTLARQRGLKHEDAFVAGLLHDFGWVVGIAAIEEIIAQQNLKQPRSPAAWTQLLERVHVRVGLALASKWKLPEMLCAVISQHHNPAATPGPNSDFVEVVRASDAVVSLLSSQLHVSADDLAGLPLLQGDEPRLLALALPEIPSLISSFNIEPAGGAAAASKMVHPEASLPGGFRPLELPVKHLGHKPLGPYMLIGIASHAWAMRGKDPLPENQLFEADLAVPGEEPLRLWAKTTLCKSLGAAWALECKPFALNGVALGRWNNLFRTAPKP